MNLTYSLALIAICLVDLCGALMCWHCIADNCDTNPEDNHKAEQRHCMEGHVCQKVVFGMQSDMDDTKYRSTVRSCSEDCTPQNDYLNCSYDLYITRGCVKRACCSDSDLCNGVTPLRFDLLSAISNQRYFHLLFVLVQSAVVFGALFVLRH